MLIFHWFLQYNMHVRLLHTLSKFKLARARSGIENVATWKCCFFIGFYSIICMSAIYTPCRNWSLHVRGEVSKTYKKWVSIGGKKCQKSMKICQNLSQKWNSSKKSLPKHIFTNFGLILGSPGGLKITKISKKNKPKK